MSSAVSRSGRLAESFSSHGSQEDGTDLYGMPARAPRARSLGPGIGRHDSIPAGIETIRRLGQANRFAVDATEEASAFRSNNLRRYDAVIFLSTTGDVLGKRRQSDFERYIRDGGGYVGIHSAADTEYDWP
ncbi:MAG: glycosyl hydrolase, partial [Solirubrobacterales bacterium]|nr:glycosyl hydrolase [Solirubrobacterales bacterium]